MSTHRAELLDLRDKARRRGTTCTFFIDEEGRIDAVFYRNRITSPLAFAEMERSKPHWYQTAQRDWEAKRGIAHERHT